MKRFKKSLTTFGIAAAIAGGVTVTSGVVSSATANEAPAQGASWGIACQDPDFREHNYADCVRFGF